MQKYIQPKQSQSLSRRSCISLEHYLYRGFSVIPLRNDSKISPLNWGVYQRRKADRQEINSWLERYGNFNTGIVTGDISKLAVMDVDDPGLLPEIFLKCPEAKETARVRTPRCFHFYFRNERSFRSRANFLNIPGLELKANGSYVVAPFSQIEEKHYSFEISLDHILPFPQRFVIEKRAEEAVEYPHFHGGDRFCIKQILNAAIEQGSREIALFTLYQLLLKRNLKAYAQRIVRLKNENLNDPLSQAELEGKVFHNKFYDNLSCAYVLRNLNFIECKGCVYSIRRGEKMDKILHLEMFDKMLKMSPAEAKILICLIRLQKKGIPSNRELASLANMDKNTVNEAIIGLKRSGLYTP